MNYVKSILVLGIISVVIACNSDVKKNDASTIINTDSLDNLLLEKARNLFKALPATAESETNPVTKEKVALGKMLYYDTRLSKTGKNSCNTCHNLTTYGVDNKPTSLGDAGKNGERNSPTVLNAALHTTQFWDGRAKDVEEQAGMPVMNPVEMNIESEDALIKKISNVEEYKSAFSEAFPETTNPITFDNMKKAIAAFERTLITPSAFDKFLEGDIHALNEDQKKGLGIFMKYGCAACHNGALLGGNMFQKFGLIKEYRQFTGTTSNDEGRKKVTNLEADKDVFKVPSLRNIEKTYPYFHDGIVNDLASSVRIMVTTQTMNSLPETDIELICKFLGSLTGEVPKEALQDK